MTATTGETCKRLVCLYQNCVDCIIKKHCHIIWRYNVIIWPTFNHKKQWFLQVSSVFPCHSSLHHCSILIYHRPLRCPIALPRQHIITSWGFKLWALSLTQHLVGHSCRHVSFMPDLSYCNGFAQSVSKQRLDKHVPTCNNGNCVSVDECYSSLLGNSQRAIVLTG
jgi:hypothetical protein